MGRALFAYDQAAWHATDAFLGLHPNTEGLTHYLCIKTPTGWLVTFPKWSSARDRLLAAYEARETEHPGVFKAAAVDPPRETDDSLVAMELALETALKDFRGENRPYNTAVLPAPHSRLYVYIYPGQTKEAVWPIGGEVRCTISADGTRIVEKRTMHESILDIEYDPKLKIEAGTHSLSDMPEDTDVLCVLERQPRIPEYVDSSRGTFVIETDGSIHLTKK